LCTWYLGVEVGAYAIYLSRKHLSAKIRTFVDFVAEKLSQDPDWDAWMTTPKKAIKPRRRRTT